MIQDHSDGPVGLPGDVCFDSGHLVDDDDGDDDCLPFALGSHDTSSCGFEPSPRGIFDFNSSEALGASLAATSISNSQSSRDSATSTLSIAMPERHRGSGSGFILAQKRSHFFSSTEPGQRSDCGDGGGGGSTDDAFGAAHQKSLPPAESPSSPRQLDRLTTEEDSRGTIQLQVPADHCSVILPGIKGEAMVSSIPNPNKGDRAVHEYCPASSADTASTAHMSDEFQSANATPLFPSSDEEQGRPPSSVSDSLGFSDLMKEADDAVVATDRSFDILEAVPEEEADETTTQSSAATPMLSNCAAAAAAAGPGLWGQLFGQQMGGATIVPAAPGDSLDHLSLPQRQPVPGYDASSTGYRNGAGERAQASHLDGDTFRVTARIPRPCSVGDVIDVLASPDLLRLWCVPVKASIVTREGSGLSNEGGTLDSSGGNNREYDGEWVEVTTTQLVSPATCGTCVYKGVATAKAQLGFPSHGSVRMFVERNRGQVGLTIGPFVGGDVAHHTITVQDARDTEQNGTGVQAVQQDVVTVTNTVRINNEGEGDGYSCGLFDALGKCFLPGLADYIGQATLSLENLCDLVCAGETAALSSAATCSIDFGAGGLQGDNSDGRTPLLAQY